MHIYIYIHAIMKTMCPLGYAPRLYTCLLYTCLLETFYIHALSVIYMLS